MIKELKISFLGDICPINRVEQAILTDDFSSFSDIKEILDSKDLVIANLECPLIESGEKISKIGPNLKGNPKTINLLHYLNIDVVALANNHILDYGVTGLDKTVQLLKKEGIEYVGAGLNRNDMVKPLLKTINGVNICLINVCEKEFNVTDDEEAGAHLFDIISVLRDIKQYRPVSDLIVLFYHGGVETYNMPTPEMYKNFRYLAEEGVDLIVCDHQHTYSGYEQHAKSHIFYGLGNFIFDIPSIRNKSWNYGVILNFAFQDKDHKSFELIPYEQCNGDPGLTINQKVKDNVLKEIDNINLKLTEILVNKEWEKFAIKENKNVLSNLLIQNRYFRYLLKKSNLIRLFITRNHEMRIYGYFICQSHSELMRKSLRKKSKIQRA